MFDFIIQNYGSELVGLILCAIFGVVGYAFKQLAAKYLNNNEKRAIAGVVVEFVEQAWKTLHGAEKLQKALETAEALFHKKRIPFDAEEMTVLIEAAVAEFNDVFKKPMEDEGTASATYRAPETE